MTTGITERVGLEQTSNYRNSRKKWTGELK